MTIRRISPKQRRVLTWWCPGSADCGCDAIICDGAVRSGKTFSMGHARDKRYYVEARRIR